jgi:hypothetical protein
MCALAGTIESCDEGLCEIVGGLCERDGGVGVSDGGMRELDRSMFAPDGHPSRRDVRMDRPAIPP